MREEITREVRTWNWVKTKAQQTQGCRTHESSTKGDVYNVYIINVKWIAISFSRRSSRPRNRTRVSHIAGRSFTVWATRKIYVYIRKQEISQTNNLTLQAREVEKEEKTTQR